MATGPSKSTKTGVIYRFLVYCSTLASENLKDDPKG